MIINYGNILYIFPQKIWQTKTESDTIDKWKVVQHNQPTVRPIKWREQRAYWNCIDKRLSFVLKISKNNYNYKGEQKG